MDVKVPYATFEAFKPHFNALATAGYFKLVPRPQSNVKYYLHSVYQIFVWVIIVTYNLQHLIKVIQVRHSVDQIVNILFILLTTLNTLGKQFTFFYRSRRIDDIIDVISGPIFAPQNPSHEKMMRTNARTMHHLLKFYICSIFICGAMWGIFPFVNRALGEDVQFTGYFPFDTDRTPNFQIVVVYMNVFITLQAFGNVTMDCTIVAFYAQVKVQLQILRFNLEHLNDDDTTEIVEIENDEVYKDFYNVAFKRKLQNKFVQCVVRHLKIKWFVKEVEAIFAEALLFQFLVTAWVICMTVYKIVGLNFFSAEFVSIAMYLVCMLAQLYIYCYYGTQVKYESELVNQSVYCGNWLPLSPRFRRQLLMMMENCKRPITPRTAYIVPISLETYIAVLRASYTLFTFLDRK